MSILGRRRHSRFLLAQPVDGHLRVREEVAIEEWNDGEVIILSPEPCRTDEHLTLEVPGGSRRRIHVRVRESRPAVVADGGIRHRLKLAIEPSGVDGSRQGGHER
jgi:hypothetical protein